MQKSRNGLLLVISGPSGVGKGTICDGILDRSPNARLSISATTRPMRQNEIDGVDYFFKSYEEFDRMIKNNEFLEYMHVFGTNYYGTPKAYVEDERRQGHDIILEIDVQGAMKVKEVCPDAICIFIAPPSMSDIKTRLIGRGTESDAALERRYSVAFEEMKSMDRYDYVVVNDIIDKAVSTVCNIIDAERCRMARNGELLEKFRKELKGNDELSAD